MAKKLTPEKALEMLHNPPHNKPLSDKQRKYFGYVASHKAENGWLAKYEMGGETNLNDDVVKLPPNFNGMGYNSPQWKAPSWNGQFEDGGEVNLTPNFYPAENGIRIGTPSNGKYAKKTMPSAEFGMTYYQNGLDFKPKSISANGGDYVVNNKQFTNQRGQQLDSLSNRLRDLQYLQTQEFSKANPDIPLQQILSREETDKSFRNTNLDQKADSLTAIYGDRSIPVNQDFLKTNVQYQNLLTEADQILPLIGNKEKGLKNFGWRSILQKYLHENTTPAYKMLEQKYNGGELKKLDQLTNFTNLGEPKQWLNKYK